MTSDKKRTEVKKYLEEIWNCCQQVMNLSNCENYLNEEIVALTIEQMVAQEFYRRMQAQQNNFERASPPVISNEALPENVVPFKRN